MPPRRRQTRQQAPPEGSTNNNNEANANPVQQLVTLLTGALTNQLQAQVTTFKEFKAVGPPKFQGSMNPVEAQTWIMEMEKVFYVARINED